MEVVLITKACLLDEYLQRHGCLSLSPLTYDHGMLSTQVISLNEAN